MNGNNKYNVLTEDDINDLLTYNMNTYYLMDKFHHDSDDEDILIVTYYLSTTDDSDVVFGVKEETGYWFLFSGCDNLKNSVYLFTRRLYEFKWSYYLNYYLQKLCSTTPRKYTPLLYPKVMLFPSVICEYIEYCC